MVFDGERIRVGLEDGDEEELRVLWKMDEVNFLFIKVFFYNNFD